jgi:hypothetical protein
VIACPDRLVPAARKGHRNTVLSGQGQNPRHVLFAVHPDHQLWRSDGTDWRRCRRPVFGADRISGGDRRYETPSSPRSKAASRHGHATIGLNPCGRNGSGQRMFTACPEVCRTSFCVRGVRRARLSRVPSAPNSSTVAIAHAVLTREGLALGIAEIHREKLDPVRILWPDGVQKIHHLRAGDKIDVPGHHERRGPLTDPREVGRKGTAGELGEDQYPCTEDHRKRDQHFSPARNRRSRFRLSFHFHVSVRAPAQYAPSSIPAFSTCPCAPLQFTFLSSDPFSSPDPLRQINFSAVFFPIGRKNRPQPTIKNHEGASGVAPGGPCQRTGPGRGSGRTGHPWEQDRPVRFGTCGG